MSHDVFISHSSKDKIVADAVCAYLESRGIRCWVAPRDIMPGESWGAAIIEAIRNARIMVLIFSSNANESPQIKREVERAVHFNTAVIPMRIENILPEADLEYFLGVPHWLDAFTPPMNQHFEPLARAVKGILEEQTKPEPTPLPGAQIPEAPPVLKAPAVPAPKSNGLAIVISIAVVLLLLVGAGAWFVLHRPASESSMTSTTPPANNPPTVDTAPNDNKDISDLIKASDAGSGEASFKIAQYYEYTHQDGPKAIAYYQKAAKQGYDGVGTFLTGLGQKYYEGLGMPHDYAIAEKAFVAADEIRNPDAPNYLGMMYEKGQGVTTDLEKAKKMYHKASEEGSADGTANSKRLGPPKE